MSTETRKDTDFEDKGTLTQLRLGIGTFYMLPATESHFFSDNFSLGGEVQINYIIFGDLPKRWMVKRS